MTTPPPTSAASAAPGRTAAAGPAATGPAAAEPPPGYPQRRVVDLTAPAVAASSLPTPASVVTDADRQRAERELAEDARSERRLLLWEGLALLAVVLILVARALWLL
jgi:hypothetical protein